MGVMDDGENDTFEESSRLVDSLLHCLEIVNIDGFSFVKVGSNSFQQNIVIKSIIRS